MGKVFISQPMNGLTDEEISRQRTKAMRLCRQYLGKDIEFIDSYIDDAPEDATPLWYLGRSLQLLSEAQYAFFCDGWEEARGCIIEHDCARRYGIYIV